MKTRQWIAILTAAALAAAFCTGCGKQEQPQTGAPHIVQKAEDGEAQENADDLTQRYEVKLDERSEEAQYQYSLEDLSFVDTVSGAKVSIGMTAEEIDAVAGAPISSDNNYRIYSGLIVQFSEEGKAVALLVSGGLFLDDSQATRFKTNRGVGLKTSLEDFSKAYGSIHSERQVETGTDGSVTSENPSNAIRCFAVDGDKVEYLGAELTAEMENKYGDKLYMQDFMFDRETNEVITMRVICKAYLGK